MFSRLDSLVLVLSLVEADALGNHTHLPQIFGQALIANSCPFGDFKGPVSKSWEIGLLWNEKLSLVHAACDIWNILYNIKIHLEYLLWWKLMQLLSQINSTSSSPQACPLIVYNRSHQNIKGVGVQHCIASWPPCLARALMYEAIFPTPTFCIVFCARRYRLHLKHNLSALGARVSLGAVNSVKNYKTDVFIYSWSGTARHWDWQIALTVSVFVVKIKTEPGHLGMSRPDLM